MGGRGAWIRDNGCTLRTEWHTDNETRRVVFCRYPVTPRLSPFEQTTLAAFAEVVRRRFGARLAALELFGSRARGEGRDDSDLDLLVSIRGLSRTERHQVIDDAADLTLETGLVLSPLVVDADTFGAELPLAKEIERDGVPL